MRNVKVFSNSYPEDVQESIDEWMKDNKVRILSVSGSMNDKKDVITYILYDDGEGIDLLNS